jgi:hypothetical protein
MIEAPAETPAAPLLASMKLDLDRMNPSDQGRVRV